LAYNKRNKKPAESIHPFAIRPPRGTSSQHSLPAIKNKGTMPKTEKPGGEDGGHDMEDVSLLMFITLVIVGVVHHCQWL
jgi:hypothetical protein